MTKELIDALVGLCVCGGIALFISAFCVFLFTWFKVDNLIEKTKLLKKHNNKQDIQKVVIVDNEKNKE